jgi:hypothetical protein
MDKVHFMLHTFLNYCPFGGELNLILVARKIASKTESI